MVRSNSPWDMKGRRVPTRVFQGALRCFARLAFVHTNVWVSKAITSGGTVRTVCLREHGCSEVLSLDKRTVPMSKPDSTGTPGEALLEVAHLRFALVTNYLWSTDSRV